MAATDGTRGGVSGVGRSGRRIRIRRLDADRPSRRPEYGASTLSGTLSPTELLPEAGKRTLTFEAAPSVSLLASVVIVLTLARYGLKMVLRRLVGAYDPAIAGRELRIMFEQWGGLWVKMGQLLGLRSDILGSAFCAELNLLQYRAVGFPPDESLRIIRASLLPRRLEDVFAWLDPVPFASASIAQVHMGQLRDSNAEVVVKVLRPGIRDVFERDFRLLRGLIRLLQLNPKTRPLRLGDALAELRSIIAEETDFRFEAANMKRMRRLLRDETLVVPRVFMQHSSAGVLVTEFVRGVLMADYMRISEQDPRRVERWRAENGIDAVEVGERLFATFLRQLMEENFFHADLHPGNIILLRDGRFALIDFGSVGSLDREFLRIYKTMLRSFASQDFSTATDLMLRISSNVRAADVPRLRAELIRFYRDWAAKTLVTSLPYNERNLTASSNEVGQLLASYGVGQSWDLLKLGRAWSTIDASLSQLYPDMNYLRLFRAYFAAAARRQLHRMIFSGGLLRKIGGVIDAVADYDLALAGVVRAKAIELEQLPSKALRIGVMLVRWLKFAMAAALVVLGMGYIERFHPETARRTRVAAINPFASSDMPLLSHGGWVLLLLGCCVLFLALARVQRELARGD